MKIDQLKSVLKIIATKLNKISWVLIGSANLTIQDLDIEAEDIDILSTKEEIPKIQKALGEYEIKPFKYSEKDIFRSHLAEYNIKGVKIEIMCDFERKIKTDEKMEWSSMEDRLKKLGYVYLDNIRIPVTPLKAQLTAYMELNRDKDKEKIEKIKEKLDARREQMGYKYEMKPLFEERLRKLMPKEEDFQAFNKIIHTGPKNFIRCNTLKISPKELMKKLKEKWDVIQPYPEYPEIMLIKTNLGPGELGNSTEHILGYYYVQEVCSMMSALALDAQPGDFVLDLCASPGSKTTQIASAMENSGTLIANDLKMDRIAILASNLEKNGVTNYIVTKNDAIQLCSKLSKSEFKFDKILLDAPCSGEGTLRSSPKTFLMWNPKMIDKLSRMQKKMLAYALKCLRVGGTLVYSTCTHAPEEDESVLDFAIRNFPVKVESLSLPLKCRPGVLNWKDEKYDKEVQKSCRIYPQDNDSEGFFLCKMTLMDEIKDKGERE